VLYCHCSIAVRHLKYLNIYRSSTASINMSHAGNRRLERRSTIPRELEDPEDCTVMSDEPVEETAGAALATTLSTTTTTHIPPSITTGVPHVHKEDILKLPKEVRNLLAGGAAGMVAKSFVAPVDRIKILYQSKYTIL
jgi:hypothetical protein